MKDQSTPGAIGSNDQLGRLLPEPLFLLHTGDLFGNERDAWEVDANSSDAVDRLTEAQPLGAKLGLYDEHTVRALLAAEKARLVAIAERMIFPCCHSEEACEAAAAICEELQAA
jgi:hypothetical protein